MQQNFNLRALYYNCRKEVYTMNHHTYNTHPIKLKTRSLSSYPVTIQGQRPDGIDNNQVSPDESVDQRGAIALTQDMEDTRLVQVDQLDDVLRSVEGGRVGFLQILVFNLDDVIRID